MKIAFTGHCHLKYKDVVSKLETIHARYTDAIWITGGAVGLDSHAGVVKKSSCNDNELPPP
jgi:hypothetical protein